MYVYNILRGWGDLIYDPLTGRQGLKKDYIGEIFVGVANKAGDIFREYRFNPAFLSKNLNDIKLDYSATGVYQITADFVCDAYKETRVGQINV